MLIPKEPGTEKKVQFRIRMSDVLFNEIMAYCQWASIRYRDYFIEQACKYIFDNDHHWQKFKESSFASLELDKSNYILEQEGN